MGGGVLDVDWCRVLERVILPGEEDVSRSVLGDLVDLGWQLVGFGCGGKGVFFGVCLVGLW